MGGDRCVRQFVLRPPGNHPAKIQAGAALLWVAYGFLIGAMPVVVANMIVAAAAVYSSFAAQRRARLSELESETTAAPMPGIKS